MTSSPQPRSTSFVFLASIGIFGFVVLSVLLLAACSITPEPNLGVEPALTGADTTKPGNDQVADHAVVQPKPEFKNGGSESAQLDEMVVGGSTADGILVDVTHGNSVTTFSSVDLESIGAADIAQMQGYAGPARSHKLAARARLFQPTSPVWNTERYDSLSIRGFSRAVDTPLSTFSIDVDTASYSNVRRFLRDQVRPPLGAVRIEEMVNYFRYTPADGNSEEPFSVETEIFVAPWAPENRLVRIGISAHDVAQEDVPPRNLVFLIDVSGSMQGPDRLDLVKYGLAELVQHLRPIDRVSIVVYAGASGLVLPPTPGDDRGRIMDALSRLSAGGSTRGAAGIRLAYEVAIESFDPDGINRVILATDGDFNVGVTSRSELVELIEEKRETGVFLTVLGVGRGNLNDSGMEALADKGNGNYAYLDSRSEARKVLVAQANATLVTIAKDVKIQVEFNPARVSAYRLLGYENRKLQDRDFNDDRKDAGEIGAGHYVTALYEIVPIDATLDPGQLEGSVDPLKYQSAADLLESADSAEWLTVKLRYKAPTQSESRLVTRALSGAPHAFEGASENGRFSTAVALFGMLLRDSDYAGTGSYDMVHSLGRDALGRDEHGERAEFLQLVSLARNLEKSQSAVSKGRDRG
jgi:Ca-activated chloride channel family protein